MIVKVLIKVFDRIPNMTIFGGWPLMIPLVGGVRTGADC